MRPSKRKKERERENFADVSSLGNTLRSADEFNKAHIPGAVQLSGDELQRVVTPSRSDGFLRDLVLQWSACEERMDGHERH